MRLAAGPPRHDEGSEGHALGSGHHEMRQIIVRQPGLQVRRKQKSLVAVKWNEARHSWILAKISQAVYPQSDRLLAYQRPTALRRVWPSASQARPLTPTVNRFTA